MSVNHVLLKINYNGPVGTKPDGNVATVTFGSDFLKDLSASYIAGPYSPPCLK